MDRSSLEGYLTAKQAYDKTKELLDSLRENSQEVEHDIVRGSMSEFPYTLRSYTVEGAKGASSATIRKERNIEKLLKERGETVIREKAKLDACINEMVFINPHAALAAKYRYMDGLTWKETAKKIGGHTTQESVRKEVDRCLKDIHKK